MQKSTQKKRLLSALPFVAVLAILAGAVLVSHTVRSRRGDVLGVNTGPDLGGEVHTVRVFESISSVMAIDRGKHSRKKEIPPSSYAYDSATTLLTPPARSPRHHQDYPASPRAQSLSLWRKKPSCSHCA